MSPSKTMLLVYRYKEWKKTNDPQVPLISNAAGQTHYFPLYVFLMMVEVLAVSVVYSWKDRHRRHFLTNLPFAILIGLSVLLVFVLLFCEFGLVRRLRLKAGKFGFQTVIA